MKKAKSELNDWLRPEYNRSDLGEIVRAKYAQRLKESTNIVVLDPPSCEGVPDRRRGEQSTPRRAQACESFLPHRRAPNPDRPQTGGRLA